MRLLLWIVILAVWICVFVPFHEFGHVIIAWIFNVKIYAICWFNIEAILTGGVYGYVVTETSKNPLYYTVTNIYEFISRVIFYSVIILLTLKIVIEIRVKKYKNIKHTLHTINCYINKVI